MIQQQQSQYPDKSPPPRQDRAPTKAHHVAPALAQRVEPGGQQQKADVDADAGGDPPGRGPTLGVDAFEGLGGWGGGNE